MAGNWEALTAIDEFGFLDLAAELVLAGSDGQRRTFLLTLEPGPRFTMST